MIEDIIMSAPLRDVPGWVLLLVLVIGVWMGGPRKGIPDDDRDVR